MKKQIDYGSLSPEERLAICRGDAVGSVILDDAAARTLPTIAEIAASTIGRDYAAELQSWLVGNARVLQPADGAGLFAWALVALKASAIAERRNAVLASTLEECITEMSLALQDHAVRSAMTAVGRTRFLKLVQDRKSVV